MKKSGEEKAKALFAGAEYVRLPELEEECGVITGTMKEKEFEALYEQLGEEKIGTRIRMEA